MDWEPYDRHWIRLRGPWEAVRIDDQGREGPVERVTLPGEWSSFCRGRGGAARLTRRFQLPTNLDADERVLVSLTNVNTDVSASLNGQIVGPLSVPLGEPECWPARSCQSYDVTELLGATNELSLCLRLPAFDEAGQVGLHEPVMLEIVCVDEADEASG